MSDGVAGTGRRFRFNLRSGDVVEAVFQEGELEAKSYYVSHDIPPSFVGSLFWKHTLDEVTCENTGWYEVTAGVPSTPTKEESHPALTAAAPPANFVIDTGTVAAVEGAYCCTADDCAAICCVDVNAEPDAEESIDEYVARIDEGVAADVLRVSEAEMGTAVPVDNVDRLIAAFEKGGDVLSGIGRKRRVLEAENRNLKEVIDGLRAELRIANGRLIESEERVNSQLVTLTEYAKESVRKGDYLTTEQYLAELRSKNELDLAVNRIVARAELALHRQFFTEALAAHAESSPNRVEVLFGKACDKLRRGLRELQGAPKLKKEESSSSQPVVGPPPVVV